MWLLWVVAASAEECPAATSYLRQTSFDAGFDALFWDMFVEGLTLWVPPQMRDRLRRQARTFWGPHIDPIVARYRETLPLPIVSDLLSQQVACKVFERAQGKAADSKRWKAADAAAKAALPSLRGPTKERLAQEMNQMLGDIAPVLGNHLDAFITGLTEGGEEQP